MQISLKGFSAAVGVVYRQCLKHLLSILACGIAVIAFWCFISASVHAIADAIVCHEVPWLHGTELVALMFVAVFSSFSYFHSIDTKELPEPTVTSPEKESSQAAKQDLVDSWRGVVRFAGSLNLYCIAMAAFYAVYEMVFWQLAHLACMYLFFCLFNYRVVYRGDTRREDVHNAFRWMREENMISLLVFAALAGMTYVMETLAADHHEVSLYVFANFIAGASLFHVGASTVRYFYATNLEDTRGQEWLLTNRSGSVATPKELLEQTTHDRALLILIVIIGATLMGAYAFPDRIVMLLH